MAAILLAALTLNRRGDLETSKQPCCSSRGGDLNFHDVIELAHVSMYYYYIYNMCV